MKIDAAGQIWKSIKDSMLPKLTDLTDSNPIRETATSTTEVSADVTWISTEDSIGFPLRGSRA